MSHAKRQGAWVSAFDAGIVLGLIHFWRRATRINTSPSDVMMPTIGQSRGHGITHIFVDCQTQGCGNQRRLSFEDLGLSDETVFVEIARKRHFVCHRCRRDNVTIRADWPTPKMGLSRDR